MLHSQMLPNPHGVTVVGTASHPIAPDRATLTFTAVARSESPDGAFAGVRANAAQARAALDSHGLQPDAITASRIGLEPSWDHTPQGRRLVGFEARLGFRVEVVDLDLVEPLLVELVAAGVSEIGGVEYASSNAEEAEAQVRAGAVADAVASASAYAAAAGVVLGPLLHLEETDGAATPRPFRAAMSAAEAPVLAPGQLTVRASVVASFAIIPPS